MALLVRRKCRGRILGRERDCRWCDLPSASAGSRHATANGCRCELARKMGSLGGQWP